MSSVFVRWLVCRLKSFYLFFFHFTAKPAQVSSTNNQLSGYICYGQVFKDGSTTKGEAVSLFFFFVQYLSILCPALSALHQENCPNSQYTSAPLTCKYILNFAPLPYLWSQYWKQLNPHLSAFSPRLSPCVLSPVRRVDKRALSGVYRTDTELLWSWAVVNCIIVLFAKTVVLVMFLHIWPWICYQW